MKRVFYIKEKYWSAWFKKRTELLMWIEKKLCLFNDDVKITMETYNAKFNSKKNKR